VDTPKLFNGLPGFIDTENRLKKLDEKDNQLKLNQLVDWDIFRSTIETGRRKSDYFQHHNLEL
jgi:hypothetical protein